MKSLFKKYFKKNKHLRRKLITARYDVKAKELQISVGYGFESYTTNSTVLFLKAFAKIKDKINKSFNIKIYCDDYVGDDVDGTLFTYSKTPTNKQKIICIPDPFFIHWKETKVHDYDETCRLISIAGDKEPIYKQILWIGNPDTHKSREELIEKYGNNPNYKFLSMNWIRTEADKENIPTKYISLVDHTQYKYLLDIRGRGWSGRLKFLLFSQRPIFYVERDIQDFYSPLLKPFEHYIPVKEDLSDLNEMYEWAENNPDECKRIAMNALNFAKNHLTQDSAVEYYADILLNYINSNNR